MRILKNLQKLFQGKASAGEKFSLIWQLGAFFISNFIACLIGISVVVFFVIFIGGTSSSSSSGEEFGEATGLPESVMRWKDDVTRIAQKNDISEYVSIILAIIMVESRGEGLDIMQSSESAGLGQNGFGSPIDSMEQGIKFFANNLKLAKKSGADKWTAVQAYNFGSDYINYVGKNGGKHSTSVAEDFSRDVVSKQLGNMSGLTYSYVNAVSQKEGRTYLYLNGGNFHYTGLVQQYLVKQTNGNVGTGDYRIPFDGTPVITSPFSFRFHPKTGQPENHKGQDFGQPAGTKILASMAGKVIVSEFNTGGYGNLVVLEHQNGTWTAYAHQSELLVKVGDVVNQGDPLGIIGTTGDSTGIHLHFELRKSPFGDHVDPAPYLKLKQLLYCFALMLTGRPFSSLLEIKWINQLYKKGKK